jgi:hypothetical protein
VQQDRVAVRLRLRHRGGPDTAAATRLVLDDKGLAELPRHLVEHDAPDDVVGVAGGERADHLHRAGRPSLGGGRRRAANQHGTGDGAAQCAN